MFIEPSITDIYREEEEDMNPSTQRKLTPNANGNSSLINGMYCPHSYEYEIHRLCEEEIVKQRQRKYPHLVSCRYLIRILEWT